MTLTELLGDHLVESTDEQQFIECARALWANRFARIVKEKKEPKRG